MGTQRGVLLLTIPAEAADRFDWVAHKYEIPQEQVAIAAIAMLSGMIADRDPRALTFMDMIRSSVHTSMEFSATQKFQGVD